MSNIQFEEFASDLFYVHVETEEDKASFEFAEGVHAFGFTVELRDGNILGALEEAGVGDALATFEDEMDPVEPQPALRRLGFM